MRWGTHVNPWLFHFNVWQNPPQIKNKNKNKIKGEKKKKEMGITDHLTCLLRNLYADQEAMVRTEHGTMDWFKIGKGAHQGSILSPCLFNLYADYIM